MYTIALIRQITENTYKEINLYKVCKANENKPLPTKLSSGSQPVGI